MLITPRRAAAPSFSFAGCSLEQTLRALRSPHAPARRRAAFEALLTVPRETFAAAWQKTDFQPPVQGWESDCLGRCEVELSTLPREHMNRAVVTVLDANYVTLFDCLLDTLRRFGNCPGVSVVVFCVGDAAYEQLADVAGVHRVRCRALERVSAAVKALVYSCARWLNADCVLALECDVLVCSDLEPLWAIAEGEGAALCGCAPQLFARRWSLLEVLKREGHDARALRFLTGSDISGMEWFNGGLLLGGAAAWRALDAEIRALMPFAGAFVEGGPPFADEFVMNLALNGMAQRELAPGWNVQVFSNHRERWLHSEVMATGMRYTRPSGERASVLHLLSAARRHLEPLYAELMTHGVAAME